MAHDSFRLQPRINKSLEIVVHEVSKKHCFNKLSVCLLHNHFHYIFNITKTLLNIGGSSRGCRDAPPGSIVFHFHAVFWKIGQIGGAPPLGNPRSATAYDSNNSNCKIVVSSHHIVAIIYYMMVSILAESLFQIIWKQ